MKKVGVVLLGLLLATQVGAHELVPYMIFSVQMRTLPFKKGYGQENFKSHMPQAKISAGLKVNPYLGFELGYLRSVESHRNARTHSPHSILGFQLPSGEFEGARTSARIDGTSISLVGFLPMAEDTQLLGSLGLARLRVKLHYIPFESDLFPAFDQAQIQSGIRDFIATRYVPQATVGVQHMLTQTVGLKAMIGWDGTKRFNLLANKQEKPARASLKDSYNVGLGLAYYFN